MREQMEQRMDRNHAIRFEYQQLCELIDQHDCVSFDIYDTALLRNVLFPSDIFEVVGLKLQIPQFKQKRIKAEAEARRRSKCEDIHLDEIYDVLGKMIGYETSLQAKQIELETEEEFTTANRFIQRVYDYAVSQKKRILFISDMYLPEDFLTRLLLRNGYDRFEKLWVSNQVGRTKGTGSIYPFIQLASGISDRWLHIGDNRIADVENAAKHQISAYHYKPVRSRINLTGPFSLRQSIMKAIQINFAETTEGLSYWERFGIETVSSLFYGFMTWLVGQLEGKKRIYFLSRDGYLPYRLYQLLAENRADLPEPVYLYASRRAYQIPNALNMDQQAALQLFTAYNPALGQKLTLGEVLDNLHLERQKYAHLLAEYGFSDYANEIRNEHDRRRAQQFLKSIFPDIAVQMQKEMELLREYLRENGFDEQNEIHVMDVGWGASTQKALKDITGRQVYGYYFGTTESVYPDIAAFTKGYAFHLGRPYKNRKKVMRNVMMYEFIFSAPHGSLIGFSKENGKVIPVLKDTERNEDVTRAIQEMHNGVMTIFPKYIAYQAYLEGLKPEECLRDYWNFIDRKCYDDLLVFSRLSGSVAIGDSPHTLKYVTVVSMDEYCRNKTEVLKQISRNLWPNTLIVEGMPYRENKSLQQILNQWLFAWQNFGFYSKLKKAIRHPGKAVRYILLRLGK